MRILITNLTLASRTGTEIVVRDLALGFHRLGHAVDVYSPDLGPLAEEIARGGVRVVSDLARLDQRPDVIHGQHHVETTEALLRFPDAPAVFVCHDRDSWHDSPPILDAVVRYAAVDRNCLERLVDEAGIPASKTRLIRNAVDLERFRPRPALPAAPKKALVFSNYVRAGAFLSNVEAACARAGIEWAAVGSRVGRSTARPEEVLPEYDIVFAKGRCALEAAAVGAAVVLCDPSGIAGMVGSETAAEDRDWNFGARCLQGRPTIEALSQAIAAYDADDASRVRDFIREDASLDKALRSYLRLYREALSESNGAVRTAKKVVSVIAHGHALIPLSAAAAAARSIARRMGALESAVRRAVPPLYMRPLPPRAAARLRLDVLRPPTTVVAGGYLRLRVVLRNDSSEYLLSLPPYPLRFGLRLLDGLPGERFVNEPERIDLDAPIAPGAAHEQELSFVAPSRPGPIRARLTLVQEFQFWMDQARVPLGAEFPVEVVARAPKKVEFRLSDLARELPIETLRDGSFENLGFVGDGLPGSLTFVESAEFARRAADRPEIVAVIAGPETAALLPERLAVAVAADPRRAFIEAHNALVETTTFYGDDFATEIAASARVHPRAHVAPRNVVIGDGAIVRAMASVLEGSRLGARSVVDSGAVIGAEGFQSSRMGDEMLDMTHAGVVEIGPGARVMANAVVARGVFRQTTAVGPGSRIGNAAFVSHNVRVGARSFVGHGAVVNGNVVIGEEAWVGPGASIAHALRVGDRAKVSLGAAVMRDVPADRRVTGGFAVEHRAMLRAMASWKREPR